MLLDFLPTSINTVVPPKCSISTFLLLIGSLFSFFLFGFFSLGSIRHLPRQRNIFSCFQFFCSEFLLIFLVFFLFSMRINITIFIAKQNSFASGMALGTFLGWIWFLTEATFSEEKHAKLFHIILHDSARHLATLLIVLVYSSRPRHSQSSAQLSRVRVRGRAWCRHEPPSKTLLSNASLSWCAAAEQEWCRGQPRYDGEMGG